MSKALESAEAKIIRVIKHHDAFEDCIAKYRGNNPFEIVGDPDSTQELRILRNPPLELSILAGEVVYHLRSSLDHLFFELVERNLIGPLPKNVFRTCQFPLFTDVPDGAKRSLPVDRKHIGIPDWIPNRAYTYIEGLQPYYRRDNGHHALRLLVKLSNIDKHHRLNTTVTRVDRNVTFLNPMGHAYTLLQPMLDDGAQIDRVLLDPSGESYVHMESEFVPQIAFDEPEIGPPQTALLKEVVYDLPLVVFNIFLNFKEFLS